MRRLRVLVPLLLLLGCNAIHGLGGIGVESQSEPGTDFSAIRSWQFAPDQQRLEPDVDTRVRDAIREALMARGLTESDTETDVWVIYDALLEESGVRQSDPSNSIGRPSLASGGSSRSVVRLAQGELRVAIVDPSSRKLLWMGRAGAAVSGDDSPIERATRLQEAVRLVMAEYPPG